VNICKFYLFYLFNFFYFLYVPIFLLLCMFRSLYSVCCLCVNVYCNTVLLYHLVSTQFQLNIFYIISHIISYRIIEYHIICHMVSYIIIYIKKHLKFLSYIPRKYYAVFILSVNKIKLNLQICRRKKFIIGTEPWSPEHKAVARSVQKHCSLLYSAALRAYRIKWNIMK
jgi:hypothetical protein